MRAIATMAVIGSLGAVGGLAEPAIAQATGVESMPWGANLGVVGASLAIVVVCVAKVFPRLVALCNEANEKNTERMATAVERAAEANGKAQAEVKTSIEGMRDDWNESQTANISLLRQIMLNSKIGS